jgi:hypothetical protein
MRFLGTAIMLLPGQGEALACGTFASRVSERVVHGEAAGLFATIIYLTQQDADFSLTSTNNFSKFAGPLRSRFAVPFDHNHIALPRPILLPQTSFRRITQTATHHCKVVFLCE